MPGLSRSDLTGPRVQIVLEVPSYLFCSLSAYTPFRFRPDFLEPDNPVVAELNETDEMVSPVA